MSPEFIIAFYMFLSDLVEINQIDRSNSSGFECVMQNLVSCHWVSGYHEFLCMLGCNEVLGHVRS